MLDRFKKLFEKSEDSNSLSILPAAEPTAKVSGEKLKSVLGANPAIEEMKRRFQLIMQSEKPEWLFLIGKKLDQSIGFQSITYEPDSNALLLFSSFHAAHDYVRHNQLDGQVVGMKAEDVQKNAPNWASRGLSGLTLNRCPRCAAIITVGIATLFSTQGLHALWAMNVALQRWRAEMILERITSEIGKPEARRTLKFLRDHVDCANPYLHQLIAIKARVENTCMLSSTLSKDSQISGRRSHCPHLTHPSMVGHLTRTIWK